VIEFEEAQRLIIEACCPLGTENVALGESLGRIPIADVFAREPIVPFARSAMDGFAVRCEDTDAAPILLPVAGAAFAGMSPESRLHPGTALGVATGAPLPKGADAVVPIERVRQQDGSVAILERIKHGQHVFPPGEDALPGDVLAQAGMPLYPAAIGLLASAGESRLAVTRRPRVAIVCSGDELVAVEAAPGFGQIRNSNIYMLKNLVSSTGGNVVYCETAPDAYETLRPTLESAMCCADLVITTGGASVGTRDLVKPILRELGVHFAFEGVAMRPGRPTAFGSLSDCRIAVLPGNPAAAFVAFFELVAPAIWRLAGRRVVTLPRVKAVLRKSVHSRPERTYFVFVQLCFRDGRLEADVLDNQCSSLTRLGASSTGLAIAPPRAEALDAGSVIDVDVFRWDGVLTDSTAPGSASPL
jgi:molybdopterin molybdotransferase